MKDLQRLTLSKELNELTVREKHNLTENAISSLLSTKTNFSANNMMLYLTACGKKLEVADWMGEVWEAKNVQDLHDMIRKLLENSRRRLSEMNSTIGMNYTPNALSINTLLNVLGYFKCKLNIVDI